MAEPNAGQVVTPENTGVVEPVVPNQAAETSEYTATELRAMEQGWKPLDKWEGDPEDHRGAKEYLDRGELLGKIKSQNTQLHEIRGIVANMSEHNRRVYAAGYERALVELKVQKANALREGEAETVIELDDKIDETKDAIRAITRPQQTQPSGPSEVTTSWVGRNEWYKTNKVMRNHANGIASELGRQQPGISETDLYEQIDAEMRKDFPEAYRKGVVSAPSPDGEGRRSVGGKPVAGGSFEKLLGTMTETQAQIARSLVKSGAITKEKYVEDWGVISNGR